MTVAEARERVIESMGCSYDIGMHSKECDCWERLDALEDAIRAEERAK